MAATVSSASVSSVRSAGGGDASRQPSENVRTRCASLQRPLSTAFTCRMVPAARRGGGCVTYGQGCAGYATLARMVGGVGAPSAGLPTWCCQRSLASVFDTKVMASVAPGMTTPGAGQQASLPSPSQAVPTPALAARVLCEAPGRASALRSGSSACGCARFARFEALSSMRFACFCSACFCRLLRGHREYPAGCFALFCEFRGSQDSRLFRACFACDSRVVSRHGVLHATTNGRGMNFHPFAKFSICSAHLPLQGTDSPQHLWCVQLSTQDFPSWSRGSFVSWRIVEVLQRVTVRAHGGFECCCGVDYV